jgi:hypothetical protein
MPLGEVGSRARHKPGSGASGGRFEILHLHTGLRREGDPVLAIRDTLIAHLVALCVPATSDTIRRAKRQEMSAGPNRAILVLASSSGHPTCSRQTTKAGGTCHRALVL